jgi:hypothetical protein
MIGLDVKGRIAIREEADLLFDHGDAAVCRSVVDDDQLQVWMILL